jgi:hypothetical protein
VFVVGAVRSHTATEKIKGDVFFSFYRSTSPVGVAVGPVGLDVCSVLLYPERVLGWYLEHSLVHASQSLFRLSFITLLVLIYYATNANVM